MPQTYYDHVFSLSFCVVSTDPEGDGITPKQFAAAVRRRIDSLNDDLNQWLEAVGSPDDTVEVSPIDIATSEVWRKLIAQHLVDQS